MPLTPDLPEFCRLAEQGNLVPVYCELAADYETPLSAFQKIDDGAFSFLLESAEKTDIAGRYSFLGSAPRAVFEARGHRVKITEGGEAREFESAAKDPLRDLEDLMARFKPVRFLSRRALYSLRLLWWRQRRRERFAGTESGVATENSGRQGAVRLRILRTRLRVSESPGQ